MREQFSQQQQQKKRTDANTQRDHVHGGQQPIKQRETTAICVPIKLGRREASPLLFFLEGWGRVARNEERSAHWVVVCKWRLTLGQLNRKDAQAPHVTPLVILHVLLILTCSGNNKKAVMMVACVCVPVFVCECVCARAFGVCASLSLSLSLSAFPPARAFVPENVQAMTSGAIQYGVPMYELRLSRLSFRNADTPKSTAARAKQRLDHVRCQHGRAHGVRGGDTRGRRK